jgi:hypothetical protein
MLTIEDYAKQPREQRMRRLTRTGDDLAAAIEGQSDAALSRRPDDKNWAAKEVICHLRDSEEVYGARMEQILVMDAPAQWEKGGIHPVLGRITLDGFVSVMAWHDDNHLDQLARALQGRA